MKKATEKPSNKSKKTVPKPATSKPAKEISVKTHVWEVAKTVLLAAGIFIGGQAIGAFFVSLVALGGGASEESINNILQNDFARFGLILTIEATTVYLVLIFLRRHKETFATIGLTGKPTIKHLYEAARGYAIYFVLFLIAISIIGGLGLVDPDQPQQLGFDNPQGIQLVAVFLSLVILPPIAEEILFRGFLYHRLKKSTTRRVAAVITSVLFAAAHLEFGSGAPLNWAAALDTLVLSFVLIYVVERSKSLYPAIMIHTAKNFIAFIALFVLK